MVETSTPGSRFEDWADRAAHRARKEVGSHWGDLNHITAYAARYAYRAVISTTTVSK